MEIREANDDDWAAIWPIFREVVRAREPDAFDPEISSDAATAVWMERPPGRTAVALFDGRVVGSAKMAPNRQGPGPLGGLLKHLALVQDYWFCNVFAGKEEAEIFQGVDWDTDPDWEWHSAAQDTPEQLRTLLGETIARCRSVVAGVDLDTRAVRPDRRTGEHGTLRWTVLHMIEEYARHNGHADLVRESVDGLTGE